MIAARAAPVAALAAKAATTTIPIVFVSRGGPSRARASSPASAGRAATSPAYNVHYCESKPKRLGLLHELVPAPPASRVLVNPTSPGRRHPTERSADRRSRNRKQLHVLRAGNEGEIDTAFATLARAESTRSWLLPTRSSTVDETTSWPWPRAMQFRRFIRRASYAVAGGLMSYGPNLPTCIVRSAPTPAKS